VIIGVDVIGAAPATADQLIAHRFSPSPV
jgi:hypothetical protein